MTLTPTARSADGDIGVAAAAGTAILLVVASIATTVGFAGIAMAFTDGEVPALADQLVWAGLVIAAVGFVAAVFTTAKISSGWRWAFFCAPLALGVAALGFLHPDPPLVEVFPAVCAAYFVVSGLALRPSRPPDGFVRLLFLTLGIALILVPRWNELALGFCVLPLSIPVSGIVEAISHRIFKTGSNALV